jgi:hypothetical protein
MRHVPSDAYVWSSKSSVAAEIEWLAVCVGLVTFIVLQEDFVQTTLSPTPLHCISVVPFVAAVTVSNCAAPFTVLFGKNFGGTS